MDIRERSPSESESGVRRGGILLGIFLSSARGRSTVQVEEEPEPDEQGPVVELAVTTAAAVVPVEDGVAVPADAEVLAAPDLSPNGVWVSVAGERWHRDRGCRGLRGAMGSSPRHAVPVLREVGLTRCDWHHLQIHGQKRYLAGWQGSGVELRRQVNEAHDPYVMAMLKLKTVMASLTYMRGSQRGCAFPSAKEE